MLVSVQQLWIVIAILGYCVETHCSELHEASDAYARGDFATAIIKYTVAAEAGDKGAQYALGTMYHEGEGVERDLVHAAYWYTQAAQRGHTEAQYWLCIMHREAIGVPRDYAEAFYWCRRAAETGHAQALFAVGQFYFDGLGNGFTRDHVRAYVWFSRAALRGDGDAELMLEALEQDMTPLQVEDARRQAQQWAAGGQLPCSLNNPRARYC
jgi:TPR repeat protein